MFTLLCSDLQVKERLLFQHLAANGISYLTLLFASDLPWSLSLNLFQWLRESVLHLNTRLSVPFSCCKGKRDLPTNRHCYMKNWDCERGEKMLQLFFLITRHVSCSNISFCHHYQIGFSQYYVIVVCFGLVLLSCYCFLENYFDYFPILMRLVEKHAPL